jgi:hypothetical protein
MGEVVPMLPGEYVPTTAAELAEWELGLALVRARDEWERGCFDEAALMTALAALETNTPTRRRVGLSAKSR